MTLDGVVYCFSYVTGFGLLEFCWSFSCVIIGEFSLQFSFLVIHFSYFGTTAILDRRSWEMLFSLLIVLEMCMKSYWLFLFSSVCHWIHQVLGFLCRKYFTTNLISIFCIVLFRFFYFFLNQFWQFLSFWELTYFIQVI